MMRKRYRLIALLAVVALVAAACSSGGGTTTTTAAPSTTAAAPSTTAAAPSTTAAAPATTEAPAPAIKTDTGVDAANKVINLGILADLTGIFSTQVTDITDAELVYWDRLNANGGIEGWTVNPIVEDTNYNVDQHLQKYAKIRDQVVAIAQSTGSPTSVAMLQKMIEDDEPMLFIPLTWYSGWAIPEFDHGYAMETFVPYCIEAMNLVGYMHDQGAQTVGLATFPGDYGQDAAIGVKKAIAYYGMDLVYDGEAAVIPGQDQTPVIQGIVAANPDWVFLTVSPSITAEIIGGAVQGGYGGKWTGSNPSYTFQLLDTALGPVLSDAYYQSSYFVALGTDVPGMQPMIDALKVAFPDRRPSDNFIIGWVYSMAMEAVLRQAIANGDLTRAGVIAAANSLSGVDYQGFAPPTSYTGTPNEYVGRKTAVFKPDLAFYEAAGGADQTLSTANPTTGSKMIQDFFTSDAAANFDFTEPCYQR